VAGKAEKMASVVQKLVDGAALNEGGSALLRADEVDHQQEEKAAEQSPREQIADGDDGQGDWLRDGLDGIVRH
jgi:hypothetical protein